MRNLKTSKTRKSFCVTTRAVLPAAYRMPSLVPSGRGVPPSPVLSWSCPGGGGGGVVLGPVQGYPPQLQAWPGESPPQLQAWPGATPWLQALPGGTPFPTKDQGPESREGTRDQGVTPRPPLWIDRHLWKYNLPSYYVRGRQKYVPQSKQKVVF